MGYVMYADEKYFVAGSPCQRVDEVVGVGLIARSGQAVDYGLVGKQHPGVALGFDGIDSMVVAVGNIAAAVVVVGEGIVVVVEAVATVDVEWLVGVEGLDGMYWRLGLMAGSVYLGLVVDMLMMVEDH